jgi:alkylhydroperoxidase family enzyme
VTEEIASLVDTGYAQSTLSDRHKAVLAFTDAFLAGGGPPPPEVRSALQAYLTDAEIVELATGLAMFHGFSKMVVVLGLEPEQMDTVVLPTPDVPR